MSFRWILITSAISIIAFITSWDIAAHRFAGPNETVSGRVNHLAHQFPEIPFGVGASIVFCALLPLLPRRRRWIAVYMMFMLCMAVLGAHCLWPV